MEGHKAIEPSTAIEQPGPSRTQDVVVDGMTSVVEHMAQYFEPQETLVHEQRGEDFICLKQDGMTIAQYTAKFNNLSRFIPEQVDTDMKSGKRFVQGLNLKLQWVLSTMKEDTYAQMVDVAQKAENVYNKRTG
ncbi:OLC1v1009067C1 [Oldenlandia corymbosa var. corymbosa]|uniref:OLC1v1009067C1 n=1 Tax=Oldenlandia corymbosa var. corymbosa TaxID=529605 RepID=A0AAV1DN33_OLDCO|nr:OLC1v1009067C1 [Oldenlandia corymbosa var. corymbosa]